MTTRVLVGYASRHGSTREIAEHLARRLRAAGLEVELTDVADRAAGAGIDHDVVVLGSAVHGRRWLPEARAFLHDHAAELAARPLWLFSVGMPGALRWPLSGPARRGEATAVDAEFDRRLSWRDHRVFDGVVRADVFPLVGRIALRLLTRGPGDYRDRHAVEEWADAIARSSPGRRPEPARVEGPGSARPPTGP